MGILWLRCEERLDEYRTPLTPIDAQKLLTHGHEIVVEQSKSRVFPLEEYTKVGCTPAEENSWVNAPKEAYILGIKNIEQASLFAHRHIYFSHQLNNQPGARNFLLKYQKAGGTHYDLEYALLSNGQRAFSFSFHAGFAAGIAALLCWYSQKQGKALTKLSPDLLSVFLSLIEQNRQAYTQEPKVFIVGADGLVGKGIKAFLDALGYAYSAISTYETKNNNYLERFLGADIIINCIKPKKTPFVLLTKHDLQQPKVKLCVIVDCTCEPFSKNNPLPIYEKTTSIDAPVQNVSGVDLIAIDNISTLIPVESSRYFSSKLWMHLESLLADKCDRVWDNALKNFNNKLDELHEQ